MKKAQRIAQYLLILLFGCSEDDSPQVINLGGEFAIAHGEVVTVASPTDTLASPLSVILLTLSDSRCPEDVYCIRAGEASAEVLVSDGFQTDTITTCIGADCGLLDEKFANQSDHGGADTTAFTVSGVSYRLILKDAIPYPTTDRSSERAVLQINF